MRRLSRFFKKVASSTLLPSDSLAFFPKCILSFPITYEEGVLSSAADFNPFDCFLSIVTNDTLRFTFSNDIFNHILIKIFKTMCPKCRYQLIYPFSLYSLVRLNFLFSTALSNNF